MEYKASAGLVFGLRTTAWYGSIGFWNLLEVYLKLITVYLSTAAIPTISCRRIANGTIVSRLRKQPRETLTF